MNATMEVGMDAPRRTKDGGYVVAVDELEVGDRLRMNGTARAWWVPIVAIDEKPKTRVLHLKVGSVLGAFEHEHRCRRTTLIARAPREGESA